MQPNKQEGAVYDRPLACLRKKNRPGDRGGLHLDIFLFRNEIGQSDGFKETIDHGV